MKQCISLPRERPIVPALVAVFTILLLASPSSAEKSRNHKGRHIGSPVRLTAIAEGNLLVTDHNAQAVHMMNKATLKVLRSFPIKGRPLGIAWTRGRIYVGNETTGAVEVYNRAGKWLFDLGGAKGIIKEPTDIAVDEALGRVFVVDGDEKNIKVYDLQGAGLYTIAGAASGAGQLVNPTGIALDTRRGEIVVSDYGDTNFAYSGRLCLFDYAGNVVGEIAGKAGGFSRPQGLTVDEGRIFLADGMLGQVLIFDRETGAKVKTLGSFGSGPGQLMLPLDVVVDPLSKDVFVTNNRLKRIEVFTGGGLLP